MGDDDERVWREYFREAELALEHALALDGYRETERVARARAQWEARLTAFNAFQDWQNR